MTSPGARKRFLGQRRARTAAFWDEMRRVAEPARNAPDWMHAGINLNPRNFETYMPDRTGHERG